MYGIVGVTLRLGINAIGDLRFLFLESNSGWVPFSNTLNRLEKYYEALQSIFCDEHPLKDVDHNQTKVNCPYIRNGLPAKTDLPANQA